MTRSENVHEVDYLKRKMIVTLFLSSLSLLVHNRGRLRSRICPLVFPTCARKQDIPPLVGFLYHYQLEIY